ncbi:hypothetical protein MTO96_001205 [Rhipicephalus appendiculatus]
MRSVLSENIHVFTNPGNELGLCTHAEHTIDFSDNTPVRKRHEEIEDWLKRSIIPPPAVAPAALEGNQNTEENMDLDWKVVRGRKCRARSREPSEERPAAASSGGPGGLDEGLPELKRAAAADSDGESTPSTVKDSTGGEGTVYARATCFRSQKKAGKPYKVCLAKSSSGTVTNATCECPAGASGAGSHILATVGLIALLKKGFKEVPPELSCTDLPQQWRRPRRQGIKPTSLQDVDWRSLRQDGALMPISAHVFDMCSKQNDQQEQLHRMHKLGEGLKKRGSPSDFRRGTRLGGEFEAAIQE